MEVARDEDGDVLPGVDVVETPLHFELRGKRGEGRAERLFVALAVIQGEFDTHEEEGKVDVLMLVGMTDVRVVANEKISNGGYDAFAVWTGNQQDCGLEHVMWIQLSKLDSLSLDGNLSQIRIVSTSDDA